MLEYALRGVGIGDRLDDDAPGHGVQAPIPVHRPGGERSQTPGRPKAEACADLRHLVTDLMTLRAKPDDGGVDVTGPPERRGVQDQAE
ncbi:hypothetical protein ABZ913_31465 [Streptosporangium sandarakinum]